MSEIILYLSFSGLFHCVCFSSDHPGLGSSGGSDGKESACSAGDPSSIPGLGRSPEKGTSNPHSVLAWRIPWTEEPGGL